MKVKIKSVLKTAYHDVQCFDEQQIVTRSGNTLCIKEIAKNECEFVCLNPELRHLYSFKPSTNRKGIFTAQKTTNSIDLAYYNLRGDRKSIVLSNESPFFSDIQSIELLIDDYDNNIVYGGAKSKEGACIFLADINKGKILALGFMTSFEDLKIDSRDNLCISACCHNGNNNLIRHLHYGSGHWEVTEQPYKKIQTGVVFQHEILSGNRTLFATKQLVYHFEENDLLQTLEMQNGEKIRFMVKIYKGLLLFGWDNNIQVFIEDSDEVTLLSKGHLRLQMDPEDQISKILQTPSNEQVIVRTVKNCLFIWKCQHIELDSNHFDFAFQKVQSSNASSHEGSISISTGKKYCLLAGTKNVTLWSVQKNQFVLSSDYTTSAEEDQTKKIIRCCAINPDGNSFMIAFDDKIRVYQILLTKFKFYAEFPIKRCSSIVYSHGGQLVACQYGRGMNSSIAIINTLRLVEVGLLKIQVDPLQIVWNELDDQVIVSTQSNSIQLYTVADNTRINNVKFDQPVNYVRIDYKMRRILVSTQNKVYVVSNGKIVDSFIPPFEDFHYIFPLYGIYMIATKRGELHWSSSYKFQKYSSFALFTQTPFNMVCRNSYLLAFSSFEEVQVLQCLRQNHFPKKSLNDDIVMVEKQQINEFYQKIKLLESNFDMLTSTTQIKLEQEKNNYENALQKFKQNFSNEINGLNKTYNNLTSTKVKQERETEMTFEEVQAGQVRNVHEIEQMYERKCSLLQQKVMNLEQTNLQQKHQYQKLLTDVQAKYHREVTAIRTNYEKKSKEQSLKADQAKKTILQDKQKMQFRLFQLQEQNEYTTQIIQQNKDEIIKKLTQNINSLQTQFEQVQIKNQTTISQFDRLKEESLNAKNEYQRLLVRYEESLNRIKMLEKEIQGKNQMVEEKNQEITQLKHQVEGLEKAKYVLSFRTAEIRKQLEPKEAMTDRLKSQITKLDEEFKQSKRKIFELTQRIEKLSKINQSIKKESSEVKMALKLKERVHSQMCSQIFKIYNTIDPNDWNSHFTKLYKSYIKEQKFKSKQNHKKDDTSDEVTRHLKHVELSLQQVASSNDKILRGKEKDITRRMKENSDLLLEINVMKQHQKIMSKNNNELALQNERLQKELDQSYNTTRKNSTRAQTSNTGITRRGIASRDALYQREKSMLLDRGEGSKQKDLKQLLKERSRVSSAHKTLMYRGDRRQKSAKFFDMARELQSARNTIKVQQEMLQELNQRLFGIDEGQSN